MSALERGERRRPHVETVRALSAALDLTGAIRDALVGSARACADTTAVDELSGVSLPQALTAFLGRDAAVQTLGQWLADPSVEHLVIFSQQAQGTRVAIDVTAPPDVEVRRTEK